MNDLAINFLDVSKCRGAVRLALGMADNISVHEKSKGLLLLTQGLYCAFQVTNRWDECMVV
jgi:hypothetical protein